MKQIKKCEIVRSIFLILLGSSLDVSRFGVNGLKLDSDGYYDIVVAISEKTAQNENENYVQNIKTGIQDLSAALYESTKHKFAIRSADILLPTHWNTEVDGYATTQTYKNADIRISHQYGVPQTYNPVPCGYPGHYIELPYSFFDNHDTGPYGPTGKALLTLWARLRWGVHEEHGYPGDTQFPYYWKQMRLPTDALNKPEEWRVTNCSNADIVGSYLNSENEECGTDPEDVDQVYPPSSDCLFHPFENQTATSSLMSFQFINSLLDFCDENTHSKRVPNRQNFFCQYKSIWEVIRESPDWKSLKEDSEVERTRINFRVVKKVSNKPLLFVLTEGVNKPPPEVISSVASGLEKVFDENTSKNWNVLAGLGVFHGEDLTKSFDMLYDWNYPWFDKTSYISLFEESFGTRTGFRNFGAAIQDVGNHIKDMNHEEGAIILVIKYGEETDYYMKDYYQAFESEVLGTILEQNIKVFALEGNDQKGERLKNIAELTNGLYFKIGEDTEADKNNVEEVFKAIEEILETGRIPPSRYRVAFKEVVDAVQDEIRPIPILHENVKRIFFYFHELSNQYTNPQITKGPNGISDLPTFSETQNWASSAGGYKNYLAEFNEPVAPASVWEYSFMSFSSYGAGTLLVVIVELQDDARLVKMYGNDISISVSTSAELDYLVDLNVESTSSLKGSTFSIFAKVEKNGHPIKGEDLQVIAHIVGYQQNSDILYNGISGRQVILQDDGKGSPDMTANDGIFSGSYISNDWPNEDGPHQIFVTAVLMPNPIRNMNLTSLKSPLPIDQEGIRCGSGYTGCWVETVTEPLVVYADHKRRIEFRGSLDYGYRSSVFRTTDLNVYPLAGSDLYEASWTEPVMLTGAGISRAQSYELYHTENFNNIFGPGEGLTSEPLGYPQTPGQTFKKEIRIEAGSKWYFVMRSVGAQDAPKSPWSNIVFFEAANPYIQTTTTTTTSTTPAPTSSTTRMPTHPSTPTTAPTRITTKSTTKPTTRRTTQSTTRPSTTPPTTPRSTTTVKYEVTTPKEEHWYSSKEAIATFSVFGLATVGIIGGVVTFLKISNRG